MGKPRLPIGDAMRFRTRLAWLLLCSSACAAQAGVPSGAAADIDKANHDWSTAMVQGDARLAADAYAPDAVFCDLKGLCTHGHDAIEKMTVERLAKGTVKSADARSTRRIEDGGLIYEWGEAKIVGAQGEARGGRYFTVWQRQPDGHWKIIRNLVLP